jgi:hypothetical protein
MPEHFHLLISEPDLGAKRWNKLCGHTVTRLEFSKADHLPQHQEL